MKLVYIAKLNLFVYAVDAELNENELEIIRNNIKTQLSDIEPKPHILLTNCPFDIFDGNHKQCS